MPPKQILLVDDDPTIRMLLRYVIEREIPAVQLTEFSSAEDLLSSDLATFDLLITDFNLMGMSGLALVKALRATGITTPAVLISSAPESESRAPDADFALFLDKARLTSALPAAIRHLLGIHE